MRAEVLKTGLTRGGIRIGSDGLEPMSLFPEPGVAASEPFVATRALCAGAHLARAPDGCMISR